MFTLLRPLSSSSSRRGPLSGRGVPCHLCIVCREVCAGACNRRLSRRRRRRRHPRRCATLSQLAELSDFLYAAFLTSCISAFLHRRRRPGELMHARGEGEWRRKWRKWRKSHHRLLFAQRTYKRRALSCERGFFSFASLIPWRFSVHPSRSITKVGSTVHNGGTPRLTLGDSIPFSFLLREGGAQVISDYERMPLSRYMRGRKGGKGAAPVSVPYIEGGGGSAGPLRETRREGERKRRQGALREGTRASRRKSGENKSPPHSASRRPFGRGRSVR